MSQTTSPMSMNSVEEGIPAQANADGTTANRARFLSEVSKLYDVDGDGQLDEAEQAMRDMDKQGLGHLSNQQVYAVFKAQLQMQKQLLYAKRVIIFFAVLLVILAAANVGVSFAAATLAKDTTTQNNVLVVKETGEVVATDRNVHSFQAHMTEERRRLGSFFADSLCVPYCTIGTSNASSLEIKRLCGLGLPVTVKLHELVLNETGDLEAVFDQAHVVCNQAQVETITTDQLRDGTVTSFNINSTALGDYDFDNGGTLEGPWHFSWNHLV